MKKYLKKTMMILLSVILVMSSVGMAFADETESGDVEVENIEANRSQTSISYNKSWITEKVVAIDGIAYVPLLQIASLLGFDTSYDEPTDTLEIVSDWNPENFRGSAQLVFGNGTTYNGGYKNWVFDGEGTLTFPDGSSYEGHFTGGVMSGEGKYSAANGDIYEGRFEDNSYCGYGEYTYANGDIVEAEFDGGTYEGYACVDVNGTDEKDQLKAYKWESPFETLDIQSKAFERSLFNGSVDVVYANGDTYDGSVTNSMKNGKGELTAFDGTEYDGNFMMGKKTGYANMTYSDGSLYKGYFKDGAYNGYGKLYYANGDIYDGAWKNGDREGYGKYTEVNGNYFYGIWQNDLKHTKYEEDDEDYEGYGAYLVNKKNTSDGETDKYKQKWIEGKLIRERKDN